MGDQSAARIERTDGVPEEPIGDRFADITLEQVMSLNPKKPPKGIANAELIVVRTSRNWIAMANP